MTRLFEPRSTETHQQRDACGITRQLNQFQSMRASTSYALGFFCCQRSSRVEDHTTEMTSLFKRPKSTSS
jgi:hypothetical protein